MKDHQGRASQHEIILGKWGHDQGPSNTIGEEGDEGQDKRGEFRTKERPGQGQSGRKEKVRRMKDQPEERAKKPAPD